MMSKSTFISNLWKKSISASSFAYIIAHSNLDMLKVMSNVRDVFYVCYVRHTSNIWCSLERRQIILHFDTSWRLSTFLRSKVTELFVKGSLKSSYINMAAFLFGWYDLLYFINLRVSLNKFDAHLSVEEMEKGV